MQIMPESFLATSAIPVRLDINFVVAIYLDQQAYIDWTLTCIQHQRADKLTPKFESSRDKKRTADLLLLEIKR